MRRQCGHPEADPASVCLRCGAPLNTHNRAMTYCSDSCTMKAWYARNKPRVIDKKRASTRAFARRTKLRVIDAYGGECACCGETDPDVLTIDHLAEVGRQHRAGIGYGKNFYLWLERQGFPRDDYRLLCLNCNAGRERNAGTCPHHGRVDDPCNFTCVICHGPVDGGNGGKPVCASCRQTLRRQHGNLVLSECVLCGAPTQPGAKGNVYFCPDCAHQRRRQRARRITRQLLQQAVHAYGGKCAHCGEDELLFLTIDHVYGCGEADRKLGRGGVGMYYWLRDNGFPDGFQVLCWNCNWKKGRTITKVDVSPPR